MTSWIRASKKDFELVKDIGLKETGILVSCSDYHIFYKMKMNRREAMEHYLECPGVSGDRCQPPLSSGRYYPGGYLRLCDPLLHGIDETDGGYPIPIKVRCCDTMGYGVNYPGAVIPRSVQGIIYGIMLMRASLRADRVPRT